MKNKNHLWKLLELCIWDTHFIFDKTEYSCGGRTETDNLKTCYAQLEGFAMRAPLSTPIANLFYVIMKKTASVVAHLNLHH